MNVNLYETLKREKETSINNSYARLKRYANSYNVIYTSKLTRILSTTYHLTLRYLTWGIAATFFLLFLYCESNLWTNSFQQTISLESAQTISQFMEIIGIVCLAISLIFFGISILFRQIKNRNNTITDLAKLLKEVIENERKNIETEKLSYFNLLDTMRRDQDKPESNPINRK